MHASVATRSAASYDYTRCGTRGSAESADSAESAEVRKVRKSGIRHARLDMLD